MILPVLGDSRCVLFSPMFDTQEYPPGVRINNGRNWLKYFVVLEYKRASLVLLIVHDKTCVN